MAEKSSQKTLPELVAEAFDNDLVKRIKVEITFERPSPGKVKLESKDS